MRRKFVCSAAPPPAHEFLTHDTQTRLTMAIVMLASTKITIATCTQIQNGDTP